MRPGTATDIVLLSAEWPARALLRAELLEAGFEVVAADAWPAARRHLGTGSKPRLVIVDLRGLPDSDAVLHDLRVLMKSNVLVVRGAGSPPPHDLERLGFTSVSRPTSIGAIVAAARRMLGIPAGSASR